MSTHNTRLGAVLALTSLLGCSTMEQAPTEELDDEPVQAIDPKQTSFVFDSSGIKTPPPAQIPASSLSLKSFEDENVVANLIQTSETFRPTLRTGGRVESSSPSWTLETDASKGSILVLASGPVGAPAKPDEPKLQQLTLDRLGTFGIPKGEIVSVLQRRVDRQEIDGIGSRPSAPTIHRFKTFVLRGINEIPVIGHRAVVSYGTDGAFRRALVHWPALVSTGHRVRTRLTTTEIEARATAALAREGESTGHVKLRWMYMPVPQPNGEVALKLMVGAGMGGESKSGVTEEPRVIDVEIDATE